MKKIHYFLLFVILVTSITFPIDNKENLNVTRSQEEGFFSICTAFIEDGDLDKQLQNWTRTEKALKQRVKGIKMRRFFQCRTQAQIIWAITKWGSEALHNTVAQNLMKTRRDDRFASIGFGPEPYFEIFATERKDFRIGRFSDSLNYIIVGHGIINLTSKEDFLKLQKVRFSAIKNQKIPWLRVYFNIYNNSEFVFFMGFKEKMDFDNLEKIDELHVLEYLFTGLTKPFGMSKIAGYNQFICTPLKFENEI